MSPALLLFLAALPISAAIYVYGSRPCRNQIVTLYLVLFALQMFVYGILAVELSHQEFSTELMLVVGALLYIYVGSTILAAKLTTNYTRVINLVAFAIPDEHLAAGLGGWLAVKLALYVLYGASVFGALGARVHAGVPQSLVDLDRSLLWLAWGAYYLCVMRFRSGSLIRPTFCLFVAFLLVNLFLENNGGGKRLLVNTAIVFLLFNPIYYTSSIRMAICWLVLLVLTPAAANYYESVRGNFAEMVRHAQVRDDLTWNELESGFAPREGAGVSEELKIRDAPFVLIYDITRSELEDGKLARGALINQVAQNVLPGGMFNKRVRDEDSVLSDIFNLPAVDLATTALAVIQAETFLFAYVVTPVIYILLFWIYLRLLATRVTVNAPTLWQSIENLAIVGVLMISAVEIETGLTGLLAALRDLTGILGVGYVFRLVSFPVSRVHIPITTLGASPPASR
jgi:hypothetical protein